MYIRAFIVLRPEFWRQSARLLVGRVVRIGPELYLDMSRIYYLCIPLRRPRENWRNSMRCNVAIESVDRVGKRRPIKVYRIALISTLVSRLLRE